MDATTASTTLSPQKVALLLERLLTIKSRTTKNLPRNLDKVVDDFLEAQEVFIRGIDEYMHEEDQWDVRGGADIHGHAHGHAHALDDKETVTTIITTCPEVLHTRNQHGYIPLHCVAGINCNKEASMFLIPLLAKAGYEHGVGGKNGSTRGGLLMKENDGTNALQLCASSYENSGHEVMKAFMEMDPPFFKKDDIAEYNLLHRAMEFSDEKDLDKLKFYIDLDPSCLFQEERGYYPIAHANYTAAAQYLLKTALEYDPQHPSIGGLFLTSPSLSSEVEYDPEKTTLHTMQKAFGEEKMWDMIEREVLPYRDVPILHRAIEHDPEKVDQVINRFPHSLFLRDEKNRLPIHVALEKGMKWSTGLVSIMNTNMSNLNEKDPVTGYYPFALAAEEPRCDLKTIHYLLRIHPGQIESGIGG